MGHATVGYLELQIILSGSQICTKAVIDYWTAIFIFFYFEVI